MMLLVVERNEMRNLFFGCLTDGDFVEVSANSDYAVYLSLQHRLGCKPADSSPDSPHTRICLDTAWPYTMLILLRWPQTCAVRYRSVMLLPFRGRRSAHAEQPRVRLELQYQPAQRALLL